MHPSVGEHGAKSVGIRVEQAQQPPVETSRWNSALRNKRGSLEPPNGSFDARRAAVSRDCVVHNESGGVRGIDEPLKVISSAFMGSVSAPPLSKSVTGSPLSLMSWPPWKA